VTSLTHKNDLARGKGSLEVNKSCPTPFALLTGTIGSANESGESTGGSIVDKVDDTYFGDGHSYEWEWPIQKTGEFYWTIMERFNLPENYLDASHPAL
jgi:hypothetical protein